MRVFHHTEHGSFHKEVLLLIKERMNWPDIVKSISIVCIIVGHTGIAEIQFLVHPFHVPVFFMIYGYFFSNKADMFKSIKNYFSRMIIPYAATCAFLMLFNVIKNIILNAAEGEYDILNICIGWIGAFLFGRTYQSTVLGYEIFSVGALWFLPCLFIASVVFRLIFSLKYRDIISIVIAVGGVIISRYVTLPWHIEVALVAVMFLDIGVAIRRYKLVENKSYPLLITGLLLYAAGVVVNFVLKTCVDYASSSYNLFVFDWIVAMGTSYAIFCFAKSIEKLPLMNLVSAYGSCTMTVLVFHSIESSIINWRVFFKLGYLVGGSIAMFLKLFGSILAVLLVKKVSAVVASKKNN